jgi:hypothetical protein
MKLYIQLLEVSQAKTAKGKCTDTLKILYVHKQYHPLSLRGWDASCCVIIIGKEVKPSIATVYNLTIRHSPMLLKPNGSVVGASL